MKIKLLGIFSLILCMYLLVSCSFQSKSYSNLHGIIVTEIDTRNNKVHINGVAPSSLVMIEDYAYRIENNAMFIKVMLVYYKYGNYKVINFEQALPENIEKIYIEDDKNCIMIWEKAQGYALFNIQDNWNEELLKLSGEGND